MVSSTAAGVPAPTPVPPGPTAGEIRVSLDSCCQARGTGRVFRAVQHALAQTGASGVLKQVGCVGMCHQTPLVEIDIPGRPAVTYGRVQAEDVPQILLRHFQPGSIGSRARAAASRLLDTVLTDEARRPITRYRLNVRDRHVHDFLSVITKNVDDLKQMPVQPSTH